jgi:D-glycero-D-manno-heptose 1,7-bisphosphate phosphatase
MKEAAIFFDRDNTLIVNDGYLGDPDGVILVDGAADAVAQAHELGYRVVTVSNQSGVAKGLFTEEDVAAVNAKWNDCWCNRILVRSSTATNSAPSIPRGKLSDTAWKATCASRSPA